MNYAKKTHEGPKVLKADAWVDCDNFCERSCKTIKSQYPAIAKFGGIYTKKGVGWGAQK